MINNKKIKIILLVVNIVYLTILTFSLDTFKENYSMITYYPKGYIIVVLLCILMSFSLLICTKSICNKYLFMTFGPIIGSLLPYNEMNRGLIGESHVILAYIGFAFVNIITIINIYYYKTYNQKKGSNYLKIFIIVFFADCIYYLNCLGVIAIHEYILLSTIIIINTLMAIDMG